MSSLVIITEENGSIVLRRLLSTNCGDVVPEVVAVLSTEWHSAEVAEMLQKGSSDRHFIPVIATEMATSLRPLKDMIQDCSAVINYVS